MDLINNENYKKIVYINNLVLKTLNDIAVIKETSEFTSNSKLSFDLIDFNLNVLSYISSLNYFYTKPRLKVNYSIKKILSGLISDFSLVISPVLSIAPSELIEMPQSLNLNPEERFLIVKKLGYLIDLAKSFSKKDSKTLVFLEDMYLKFIVFSKNIIDFRNFYKNLKLESPYYKFQFEHLIKVLELLEEGAFILRSKYELSGSQEFGLHSLSYLEAGRALATIASQKEVAEKFSRFHGVWSSKFSSDLIKAK
ncbi:hypothetical protein [Borreliella japonica]|uniref:hypothetical protein n=1 Tax=Borreliella japonica TaxID=34095 RepID=UPI0026497B0A|nr:hypothetical protein [Borreliella japonica]WKC88487.1 hypothetical protein QIA21_02140 [Borreliella japonica]